jgi:hypothetical protein
MLYSPGLVANSVPARSFALLRERPTGLDIISTAQSFIVFMILLLPFNSSAAGRSRTGSIVSPDPCRAGV